MASEAPTDRENYANIKTELALKIRRLGENDQLGLPKDERLIRDLLAMRTVMTSNGKLRVLDPEDASPDFFDAMLIGLSSSLTPPSACAVKVAWL
jgi:hypothetical protein